MDYHINSESVVFEVGAYEGAWSKAICNKYNPKLYAFEPQKWAYDNCVKLLKRYDNAKVFNFALGIESGNFKMGDFQSDGASLMKDETVKCDQRTPLFEIVKMVELKKFLEFEKIDEIDLFQLNVEGYEYKLIPYMIEKGILNRIKYFICQFHMHPWFPDEETKLIEMINKTHKWNKEVGTSLLEWERL